MNVRWPVFLLAGCCLFLITVSVFGQDPVGTLDGSVSYLEPPVKYRPADDMAWKTLADPAEELPGSGDFQVGEGGFVEIRTADSDLIKINEESGLAYQLSGDTVPKLNLEYGSIKANVEPRDTAVLEIETPQSTIGIRGTEFGVAFEEFNVTEAFVNSGKIFLKPFRNAHRTLSKQEFARLLRPDDRGQGVVDQIGDIPERHRTTWTHWDLRRNLRETQGEIDRVDRALRRVNRELDSESEPRERRRLRDRRRRLLERKNTLEQRERLLDRDFREQRKRYSDYRQNLESRRGNFLKKRRQQLNELRQRRIRQLKEIRRDIRDRLRDLRDQRQRDLDDARERR